MLEVSKKKNYNWFSLSPSLDQDWVGCVTLTGWEIGVSCPKTQVLQDGECPRSFLSGER